MVRDNIEVSSLIDNCKIKEISAMADKRIMVVEEDEKTAKRIAQGYNLLVIEGIPRDKEQLAMLNEEIQRRLGG